MWIIYISGIATNLSWGALLKAEIRSQRPTVGRGATGKRATSPPARDLVECCKLPQRGSGHNPDCKGILDASRAQRTHLVSANVVSLW